MLLPQKQQQQQIQLFCSYGHFLCILKIKISILLVCTLHKSHNWCNKEMIVKTLHVVVTGVLLLSQSYRDSTRPKKSIFHWKFVSISTVQVHFRQFGTLTSNSMVGELVLKITSVYFVSKMAKIYIPMWKKCEILDF